MPLEKQCKLCGARFVAYNTIQNKCRACTIETAKPLVTRKPIAKVGPKEKRWQKFRKGYLKGKKNHQGYYECPDGTWTKNPDVDHTEKRSLRPDRVFDESNLEMMSPERHRLDEHVNKKQ
jgi:hypothetical protein